MKILINDWLNYNEKLVEINSLKEASTLVCKTIEEYSLGSSQWYESNKTGNVYDDRGKCIAHVSYNGRVWEVDKNENPTGKEIIV